MLCLTRNNVPDGGSRILADGDEPGGVLGKSQSELRDCTVQLTMNLTGVGIKNSRTALRIDQRNPAAGSSEIARHGIAIPDFDRVLHVAAVFPRGKFPCFTEGEDRIAGDRNPMGNASAVQDG